MKNKILIQVKGNTVIRAQTIMMGDDEDEGEADAEMTMRPWPLVNKDNF
jgi:hypothetical protein